MNINKKILTGMLAAASAVAMVTPALAQTDSSTPPPPGPAGQMRGTDRMRWSGSPGMGMMPGVGGIVTAINGTTLTVTGHGPGQSQASTTYSVDASNATVFKNNATSSLSAVSVGDMVFARGTVSGTDVTATSIRDGMFRGSGFGGKGGPRMGMMNGQNPIIKGNGQPVVAGTVSAVSGTSLTVTTSSNVTYTVDASTAVVDKDNATSSLSAVSIGDYVIVQGAVNGSSVTASSIIDGPAHPSNGGGPGDSGSAPSHAGGFFGAIGQFFRHLFGF